jgi:membrane-associated protease RseP (regulator of RpoE activity)
LKIKSSGIVFFGLFNIFKTRLSLPIPIVGAFVEPDDKDLYKRKDIEQYSVFAAGPISNVVLALAAFLVILLVFVPLQNAMTVPTGISFSSVNASYPAGLAGMKPGMTITSVDGVPIKNSDDFLSAMSCVRPNQSMTFVSTNGTFSLITVPSPDSKTKGYIGIFGIINERELINKAHNIPYDILKWFAELFNWIVVLSLGIGLANLLPLGPVDGGRMIKLAAENIHGKKKGEKIWKITSIICLLLLVINLGWPLFKWIFSLFI